jgi:hypothetical protein
MAMNKETNGMERRKVRVLLGVAVGGALLIATILAAGEWRGLGAQGIPYSGEDIAPVYEGWRNNPDGTIDLLFGYFNRNQQQELDIPVGPDNTLEPGGPDQSQPTHFYPRRNRFVFRVQVPKDFGKNEIVWTLVSNGKKNTAYATLRPDYYTDDIVIMNDQGAGGSGGGGFNINGNKPPTLKVEGEKSRSVSVGQPVSLAAVATDDGIPKRRVVPLVVPWTETAKKQARIGMRCCADSASGLRLSWFVFRGPAANVTFDPPQFEQWEDYRDGRNSPWSAGWEPPPVPQDNRWVARAKFSQPGTYVIRALAHDGGLMTSDDITVIVK